MYLYNIFGLHRTFFFYIIFFNQGWMTDAENMFSLLVYHYLILMIFFVLPPFYSHYYTGTRTRHQQWTQLTSLYVWMGFWCWWYDDGGVEWLIAFLKDLTFSDNAVKRKVKRNAFISLSTINNNRINFFSFFWNYVICMMY